MTDADSIWKGKCRRLQDLDDQLDQEREANRGNMRIIAALTSRIPAIETSSETPGSSPVGNEVHETGEAPEGAEPRPATER
jgi:hypothetical protein